MLTIPVTPSPSASNRPKIVIGEFVNSQRADQFLASKFGDNHKIK